MKGKCTKGDSCDYWHPPVCRFFRQGNCSAGKKCSFLHPPSKNSATPAPKQDGNKNENKNANKKGKEDNDKNAEEKPQGRVFFHAPLKTCFASIQPKAVHFSKFSQKKSVKDCKNPTYLKWNLVDKDYVPKRSNPAGTVIFPRRMRLSSMRIGPARRL